MTKELTQGFSLENFTAAVIGVGGLGCNAAVHLAGEGIGNLILCDFDNVSLSNLNRQFLYTEEDIGKKKVFAAKERLKKYAPAANIITYDIKITKDNIPEKIKECDIIFLAVDNKEAREDMFFFAQKNKIPLSFGGIDGFYGKTYLYIPDITPCPLCAGMLDKKKAASNISAAAGIIGSLQVASGTQFILTKDKTIGGKLTVFDRDTFSTLKISPRKQCIYCKNIFKKEEMR